MVIIDKEDTSPITPPSTPPLNLTFILIPTARDQTKMRTSLTSVTNWRWLLRSRVVIIFIIAPQVLIILTQMQSWWLKHALTKTNPSCREVVWNSPEQSWRRHSQWLNSKIVINIIWHLICASWEMSVNMTL